VALTEATADAVPALAEELGMQSVLAPSNAEFPRRLGLHVAWLSGRPIHRTANHALPALSKTLLEIEVDGIQLFATHLASRHEQATHPKAGEVRAILGVLARCGAPHLLAGDLNALWPGDAVGAPPPGVIPRGDAAEGAPREALRPLAEAGYVDCCRALHDEPGYTYPAEAPWLRLDYVLASPNLAARLFAAGVASDGEAARASDHLPVWAEFALLPSPA
jgi:endonuclease/exonuclease/phosphatase family metal-dependent hydrolase